MTERELIDDLRSSLEEVTNELVYQRNRNTRPEAPDFDAEGLLLVIDARATVAKAQSFANNWPSDKTP